MEQSKVIELAPLYGDAARKITAEFRQFEDRLNIRERWAYLDENKQVVRCRMSDLLERYQGRDPFGPWGMRRHVGSDIVRHTFWVSTVFLGLEHVWWGHGDRSAWFETMVFRGRGGSSTDLLMDRYETYDEALIGHQRAVTMLEERRGWARWIGYSQSHLRKIEREQRVARKAA